MSIQAYWDYFEKKNFKILSSLLCYIYAFFEIYSSLFNPLKQYNW